ncbi:MAG: glycosyl hydrolase family 95 catalytic domain-containing protein, partial [Clostridia bacterium]
INEQRSNTKRINHEFMRRAYEQARYAQICCGGTTAPRLYGMWTGEWNPGWRAIYTLDANVNLQVSAMNTGNLGGDFQEGYITFFLRHAPDFMENAKMAYGMHDAIQISVNADADRAMHIEYDNSYPFEYWNAGASWCLLPIYEYWQCFGNKQIPINDYMRFDNLQKVLGVNDGGLSDEEFAEIKSRGYLDLEKDILLPLLTKQANFWEQIVTPRYYTDINGNACHDESKTELSEGEKYIIIPTYSPENSPVGYNSTITANATMDISAARDGLDMICAIERAVKREGYEAAVQKWETLKNNISDYKTDSDGALREWAMSEYTENNNHRHLSHLYVAWPAYETQNDPELARAANIALDNRNRYNTGDATAGHGWMHKAIVEARLKRGDGMMKSLLKMMNGTAYYSSMMTDHDTNRRNDTYCTDTAFGTIGAVNEALVFSNTGEIEIIPALPKDWTKGEVKGLMARTRTEVSELVWDLDASAARVTLTSIEDDNTVRLSCGEAWTKALCGGEELE